MGLTIFVAIIDVNWDSPTQFSSRSKSFALKGKSHHFDLLLLIPLCATAIQSQLLTAVFRRA